MSSEEISEPTKMISPGVNVAQAWLLHDLVVDAFAPVKSYEDDLKANYELLIGDRPFAISMKKLWALRKQALPAEIGALKGDTYLITHMIGLLARKQHNAVTSIGYRASFSNPGTTIDISPNSEFTEYFGAGLTFEAGVGADGHVRLPSHLGELSGNAVELGMGARLQLGTRADIIGNLLKLYRLTVSDYLQRPLFGG